MKGVLLLSVFVCVSVFWTGVYADNWALLVAGSNGYWNYRHQADVCHAYQILHKLGIPDSRIVTMMFDDIANSSYNPFPGNIINIPGGPNVYEGVLKDYTGMDVTPQNFLNILSGNAAAMKGIGSGKVIASTKKDKIFVYFTDHGATDLIAFPNDYLYANDLNNTLTAMHTNQQYKELMFYLEACESGSMFAGILASDLNIYVTTASTPTESSYACYYDDTRQTYLADCYSINWMVNTEDVNVNKESLESQYDIVKQETANTSEVCQYGTMRISNEMLNAFFREHKGVHIIGVQGNVDAERSPVDQRDVELAILKRKLQRPDTIARPEIRRRIEEILAKRIAEEKLFEALGVSLVGPDYKAKLGMNEESTGDNNCDQHQQPNDFRCFKFSLESIEASCGKLDHYGLKFTSQLVKMCNYGIAVEKISRTAMGICHPTVRLVE